VRWEDDDPTLFCKCAHIMCDRSKQGNLYLLGRNPALVALFPPLFESGINALQKCIVKM
jgi:hypothetical protein